MFKEINVKEQSAKDVVDRTPGINIVCVPHGFGLGHICRDESSIDSYREKCCKQNSRSLRLPKRRPFQQV
jgi:hypothetical protein